VNANQRLTPTFCGKEPYDICSCYVVSVEFVATLNRVRKILAFVCYRGLIVLPVNALKCYYPIILSKLWGLGT